MMMTVPNLMLALSLLSSAPDAGQPATRLEPLQYFVGHWRVDAELTLTPGKTQKVQGDYAVSPALGGAWLTSDVQLMDIRGREVLGYDPARKEFFREQFLNDGTRAEV